MQTPEFYRHFPDNVPLCTLMSIRLVNKVSRIITEQFVFTGKRRGAFIVHDGCDRHRNTSGEELTKMRKNITQVIFPLNITKVGVYACTYARNVVVVDIPEGVDSIGYHAFGGCISLITQFSEQLSKQSAMFETKIKEQSATFTAQNHSLHASIASLKQSLLPTPTTKHSHST
ncbi:hypothetical protein TrLO_g2121 [Triparma laevis f. longispina]|nr:hypothetical protein TrLO_g2121 [Triparma laevis f. longispina]